MRKNSFLIFFLSLTGVFFCLLPVLAADQAYCALVGNKTDLAISQVKNRFNGADAALPDELTLGDSLSFEAIVTTGECSGIEGTTVEVYDNDVLIGEMSISAILANGSGSNRDYLTWKPTSLGSHTLRFIVDLHDFISEVNNTNNDFTKTVRVVDVSGNPDCQTVGNKTDLKITGVKNRYNGADADLPSNLLLPGSLAFEAIVATNQCNGINGTFVDVYDNDLFIKRLTISGILSNGSGSNINFYVWTPGSLGFHTLKFVVDPDNAISEVYENNNTYYATVTVANSPSNTFDLKAEMIASNNLNNPKSGQTINFTSLFKVFGIFGETDPFSVAWQVDNVRLKTENFNGLSATATSLAPTFSWVATAGNHTAMVTADVNNQLLEINEGNNSIAHNFNVADSIFTPPITSPENPLSLVSGKLIKNQEFVEVFFVDSNLCLHWIINEIAARNHFGSTWNKVITQYDQIPRVYRFCETLN